jgi:hypothetical protein
MKIVNNKLVIELDILDRVKKLELRKNYEVFNTFKNEIDSIIFDYLENDKDIQEAMKTNELSENNIYTSNNSITDTNIRKERKRK